MKRLLALCLSLVLFATMGITAYAAEQPQVVSHEERVLENGITVIEEITVYPQGRSVDKLADVTGTFKDGNTVIAIIVVEGVFRYDGTTVSVVSKAITRADTYAGWSFKEKSFTSSGGTITLEGKLSKWLVFNSSFTVTLSCDKDGNISR